MIRNITAVILILSFSLSAGVYIIKPNEDIRGDYFYTIPHIVEDIAELSIRVFDAVDQDISRLGKSSMRDNSTALFVNGIRRSTLQDGLLASDLRPVANGAIDSIVVSTGVHTNNYAGNFSVVIDIITRKITKNSVTARVYTGSEVGDPTVLLKVMDEDSLVYNKEQLAAGELYGTLKRGKVGQFAAVNMIYNDRYSNGQKEKNRNNIYPGKNSEHSMEQIRKGYYNLFIQGEKFTSSLDVSANDYTIFHYDSYRQSYNYFEGTRGNLSLSEKYSNKRLQASISLALMYENGRFFTSDNNFIEDGWGDYSLLSEFSVKSSREYKLTLSINGNNYFGSSPITKSDSASYLNLEDLWQVRTTLNNPDEKFSISLAYPPALTVLTNWSLSQKSSITGGITAKEQRDSKKRKGFYFGSEIKYGYTALNGVGFSVTAGYDYAPKTVRQRTQILLSNNKNLPWVQATFAFKDYFNISLYGSTYNIKADINSQFNLNGLNVAPGLTLYSYSSWHSENKNELSFFDYNSNTTTLPSVVTGNITIAYNLFNDHLCMAISARDLGPPRLDHPDGCMVGPVIVSNFSFQF